MRSCRALLASAGCRPVAPKMGDQVGGALVGEEQLRAFDLDDLGDARDRVAQPSGPGQAEERVASAPHEQRGGLELLQLRLYGEQRSRLELRYAARELGGAQGGLGERPQVGA